MEFFKALGNAVAAKQWEQPSPSTSPDKQTASVSNSAPKKLPSNSKLRSGIVGIERSIDEQSRATNESISIAFQDLKKLMEKAKEMVAISKNISNRIRVSPEKIYIIMV